MGSQGLLRPPLLPHVTLVFFGLEVSCGPRTQRETRGVEQLAGKNYEDIETRDGRRTRPLQVADDDLVAGFARVTTALVPLRCLLHPDWLDARLRPLTHKHKNVKFVLLLQYY